MLAFRREFFPRGGGPLGSERVGEQKRGLLRVFQTGGERVFYDALHAIGQISIQIKSGAHGGFLFLINELLSQYRNVSISFGV